MKKTHANLKPERLQELFAVFARLDTPKDYEDFLVDLCTPTELHAMADRWYIAREIHKGTAQFDISQENRVSLATITRVSRCLKNGNGYKRLLSSYKHEAFR